MVLQDCQPQSVFRHFEQISRLPHGSHNEKAVSDYVVGVASSCGLWCFQDEAGNVIVKKNATAGYEDALGVILQSHLDMVCQKAPDAHHDFLKDPITLILEGDTVRADRTTLGADDGIGVSMVLALLMAEDIPHPAMEAVFTVNEESGMDGARVLNTQLLTHKRLINLDMEVEGVFTVSCAGGVGAEVALPAVKEPVIDGQRFFSLRLWGLRGGHSGLEIDKGRANANVLMGRLLDALSGRFDLSLASLSGGVMHNAIPDECRAVVGLKTEDETAFLAEIDARRVAFQQTFSKDDPGLTLDCTPARLPHAQYGDSTFRFLTKLLTTLPDGVNSMSPDIPGLVESSCNLGVVREEEQRFVLVCAVRSAAVDRREQLTEHIREAAAAAMATVSFGDGYPAWAYRAESPLRDQMSAVYYDLYGKSPEISAVHAGLECSLLAQHMPGVDMIAIGPDIRGAHTPLEALSVSSAQRVWTFLLACLARIKS